MEDMKEWTDKTLSSYATDLMFMVSMHNMNKPSMSEKQWVDASWALTKFKTHLEDAQASLRNYGRALYADTEV